MHVQGVRTAILSLLLWAVAGCAASQPQADPFLRVERAAIEWVEVSQAVPARVQQRLSPTAHGDLMQKLVDSFNAAGREYFQRELAPTAHLQVAVAIRDGGVVTLTPAGDDWVVATIRGQAVWLQSARLRYIVHELGRLAFQ